MSGGASEPEPLLAGPLVGAREPTSGEVTLTGPAPGPAGMATVELAGGAIELSVDTAEPEVVAELVVRAEDPSAATALAVLFGGGWDEVRAQLSSDPRRVWVGGSDEPAGPWAGAPPSALPIELSRWAVLAGEARPGAGPGAASVEAVRALELVALADRLPADLGLPASGPAAWRDRARGLLDLGPGAVLDALVPAGGFALGALLRTAADSVEDAGDQVLAAALRSLAVDLERASGSSQRHLADAAAPAPARPMAPAAALPPVAAALPTGALGGARPAAMAKAVERGRPKPWPLEVGVDAEPQVAVVGAGLEGGHVEVSVSGAGPGDLWLRVFVSDPRSPLLVAQSRLRTNPFGTASASALLPAGLDPSELLVDVVADAAGPWRPPVVHRTRRAAALGRLAVRTERVAGPDEASASWARCGQAWGAQGDDRRRSLAASFANGRTPSGGTPRQPMRSFVTDSVRADPGVDGSR